MKPLDLLYEGLDLLDYTERAVLAAEASGKPFAGYVHKKYKETEFVAWNVEQRFDDKTVAHLRIVFKMTSKITYAKILSGLRALAV